MRLFATAFAADADDKVDEGFLRWDMLPKRIKVSIKCNLRI